MRNLSLVSGLFTLSVLSSCAVSLPSFRRTSQSTNVEISNPSAQVEPLRRDDYEVLKKTSGSSSTSKFYLLFFQIGKGKSDEALYENAYDDALDNLPGADALLLPRRNSHRFTVPLIVVNYFHKKVVVSGVGISVKGKKQ